MLEPKFKVGDHVRHKSTGRIFTIVDVFYNRSVAAPGLTFYENGASKIETKEVQEHYSYRLSDGFYWRYHESLLELL